MNIEREKTVMLFVINDDKLLMLRRLNTWFGNNQFAVPGGLVDEGETPEEAGVRETLEETGLILNKDDLQLIKVDQSEAKGRKFENYYFLTSIWSGELSNIESDRHSELDWYPLSKLPKDTMPLMHDIIKLLP